ncbi:MAG: SRPBCC family protein [Deltaproteobacteria bacterium]|nr:SRPBCC family protein [Deltaproteobacteria bacterium]
MALAKASSAARDRFVYVTYIRTTADKLWNALTDPEFTRKYWFGMKSDSTFKKGAPWKLQSSDGTIWDAGEVLEAKRPKKLVLAWQHQMKAAMKKEGFSRCTFELEPAGGVVKLTVTHEIKGTRTKFISAVSGGWPMVLSGLKTVLETDQVLQIPR